MMWEKGDSSFGLDSIVILTSISPVWSCWVGWHEGTQGRENLVTWMSHLLYFCSQWILSYQRIKGQRNTSINTMHNCSVCFHLYRNLALSPMSCPLTRTCLKRGDHSRSILISPVLALPPNTFNPLPATYLSQTLIHYWSIFLICSPSILASYTFQNHLHSFVSHVKTIWGVLLHPFNHSIIQLFYYTTRRSNY